MGENPLADVHIEMNPEGAPGGARMTGVEDPGSTNEVKLYDANENLPPGAHMPGEMPVHMNVQHSMRGLPNIPGSQQVWVNPGNPGGKPNIMTDYQGGIQQTIGIPGTDGNPGVQIHGISPFSNIVHVNSLADVPQKALVGGVHAVTMPVANTEPEKMQSTQGTAQGAGVGCQRCQMLKLVECRSSKKRRTVAGDCLQVGSRAGGESLCGCLRLV